jgi:hypothetical protein
MSLKDDTHGDIRDTERSKSPPKMTHEEAAINGDLDELLCSWFINGTVSSSNFEKLALIGAEHGYLDIVKYCIYVGIYYAGQFMSHDIWVDLISSAARNGHSDCLRCIIRHIKIPTNSNDRSVYGWDKPFDMSDIIKTIWDKLECNDIANTQEYIVCNNILIAIRDETYDIQKAVYEAESDIDECNAFIEVYSSEI